MADEDNSSDGDQYTVLAVLVGAAFLVHACKDAYACLLACEKGCTSKQILVLILAYFTVKYWNNGRLKAFVRSFLEGEVFLVTEVRFVLLCQCMHRCTRAHAQGVVELCDIVSDVYSVAYMEQFRRRCGCVTISPSLESEQRCSADTRSCSSRL